MLKIIVANWKMNGSKDFAATFFKNFINESEHIVVFCPPFVYLNDVSAHLKNEILGAQDCHDKPSGAFTGEVSAEMLKDLGCRYVIVGHSERRQYHNESDQIVKEKAEAAVRCGLIPIVCVGEGLVDRKADRHEDTVLMQVRQSIPDQGEFVLAYEPIWAIGTGLVAEPKDIIAMHGAINVLLDALDRAKTPILYGGSVNAQNSSAIMSLPNVGGVLVGGASLKASDFNEIVAF